MVCENCGNSNLKNVTIEGHGVTECQVCGFLHGDADAIKSIKEIRDAKEKSIDPSIYPLYTSLSSLGSCKVQYACEGFPQDKVPPYVSFHILEGGYKHLEKITEALLFANKATKAHWVIEANYQKQLTFTLKPDFHNDPYHISTEQISIAQKDLEVLGQQLSEKISS